MIRPPMSVKSLERVLISALSFGAEPLLVHHDWW